MQLRICHIVAICLSLLLVVGQIRVAQALPYAHDSGSQVRHCDNPGSARSHNTKGCADECPLCQVSPKEAALLAVFFDCLLVDRPVAFLPAWSPVFFGPTISLIFIGNRVRAPPRFSRLG
jgi:hypothetical protein